MAVYKPAGLLVHRSPIDRHETRFAVQMVRDLIGRRVYPCHRLDKPAAGILLFGLSPETGRRLTEGFANRRIRKSYQAIVRGWIEAPGEIDYPLADEPDSYSTVRRAGGEPRAALTRYRPLARAELPIPVRPHPSARYSWLELTPLSGRRHQLRRHLKHIFHPILGDTTHGDGHHNRLQRQRLGVRRLMLAATRLELTHPVTGQGLVLNTEPDAEFLGIARGMGF